MINDIFLYYIYNKMSLNFKKLTLLIQRYLITIIKIIYFFSDNNNTYFIIISNSNWTEWSTIQGVIAQVISKSDKAKREVEVQLITN